MEKEKKWVQEIEKLIDNILESYKISADGRIKMLAAYKYAGGLNPPM